MNKIEQIDEIACCVLGGTVNYRLEVAELIYNKGYRKQSEVVKEIVAYLKQFEGYAQIAAEELEKKYNIPLA